MKLTIKPDTYIFPPRPKTAIPFEQAAFFAEIDWIWQYKINDTRIMIKYLPNWAETPEGIQLWNRHGEQPRNYTPPNFLIAQLRAAAHKIGLTPSQLHLLDGGLMEAKHNAIKDTIVIWDILIHNGYQLLNTTYAERYNIINKGTTPWHYSHPTYNKPIKFGMAYGPEWSNVLHLENNPDPTPKQSWATVHHVNKPFIQAGQGPLLEGMVFKDPEGRLQMGLQENNNSDWLCRCRVKTGRHAF